jgi:putative ABC transport system permease protein
MSAGHHRSGLAGSTNGGVTARRAVIRWARRAFRREWRQQVLVLSLLTVAVAAAIGSITILHHIARVDNSDFGSANAVLTFNGSDPADLRAGLAAARRSFGTVDVIGHHSVAVPGSVDKVDYRAQDPAGAYGGELLALRSGRYPTTPDQVAVTDGVAELLGLDIGSTLALDGHRRKVVGIVENPRKLSDEFALLAPTSAGADYLNVLVKSDDATAASFFGSGDDPPPAFQGLRMEGNDHPEAPALAMFSVTTVFLLLASLVAAAGFAVVAQRRLRQLGMFAAIGATEKQLRLALLANGAIVGTVAAAVGTSAGLAAWFIFAPTLESTIDHRVDRFGLPWWLIVTTALLAVAGAAAAAWWPGRAAARLPVVLALSGRPPKPRPARHSALAAVALIAVGVACLALSDRERSALIIAGVTATIFGALLLGPLAIRVFSRVAGRVTIAPRLALRDLVRFQARSGAALAAVTLALGIAAAVVVVSSAEAAKNDAEPPTLTDRQIRVYLGPGDARGLTPVDASAQLTAQATSVRRIAAQLDDVLVVPLQKCVQPGAAPIVVGDSRFFPPLDLTTLKGRSYDTVAELYVATPAVLRYLGVDPASIDPSTDFLVDRNLPIKGLVIPSMTNRREFAVTNVETVDIGSHLFGAGMSETLPAFITLGGLRRHGWKEIPAGWLMESSRPLTSDQVATARRSAADARLSIEVEQKENAIAKVMAIAIAAGGILALAILAMTVGLIRSESAGDLRTLTATGATSRIRRTLTATTAGALALLGALLGVGGAYVLLAAIYYDDLGYLSHVPFTYLALAVLGVPLVASAAGWLVAGREPPTIARTVIE